MNSIKSKVFGLGEINTPQALPLHPSLPSLEQRVQSCAQTFLTSHSAQATPPSIDVDRMIQSFKNLYTNGEVQEAVQDILSHKQAFKSYPQYSFAYIQAALFCLKRGDAKNAIIVSENDNPNKPDEIKRHVIENYFNTTGLHVTHLEIGQIDHLISYVLSFKDDSWKENYLTPCTVHLIQQKRFVEAFDILKLSKKPIESLFRKCFRFSVDWEAAYDFACWMEDRSLRDKCLRICKDFIPKADHFSEKQKECLVKFSDLEDARSISVPAITSKRSPYQSFEDLEKFKRPKSL